MDHQLSRSLQQFNNFVGIKFQLYNSLFTSLPFHRIEKTGILLSVLQNECEEGYQKNLSPKQIIDQFFDKHTSYAQPKDRLDLLFRFIQYVERQVVLFDALEDAAFPKVNDTTGMGTLKHLSNEVNRRDLHEALAEKLKEFSIRLVLTAHPTQFYPGSVLGIIHDLAKALAENDANKVNMYLQQLGKTPFFKKQKPTPYDEAISLIWYLENVFYPAAGRIISELKSEYPDLINNNQSIITMGFWPGGDRDGNPHVTTDTTLKVADELRGGIIKSYYTDVRRLKRRLTFKGCDVILTDLEKELYNNIFIPGHRTMLTKEAILEALYKIKDIIIYQHNGLFLSLVENLINKIYVFGLHFASLDIRQDSSVHASVLQEIATKEGYLDKNYQHLTSDQKLESLSKAKGYTQPHLYEDTLIKDAISTIQAIQSIQAYNGEQGCNRYIISHCESALHVLEVFHLFLLNGWKEENLTIDIVPLFETIDDLKGAAAIMEQLYSHSQYRAHLKKRKNRQSIMLGFSDGTKDGGYLMANWSIYKAKEALTQISMQYGIDVVFFDGRGGPPARGGGKTHKFYASMGNNISNKEIQLTIQGQTVSSNFGTIDAAQFNIEQLLHAGLSNGLLNENKNTLTDDEENLLKELAELSFKSYISFKEDPAFLDYLAHVSPLKFYSATNIGSRPAKRGSSSKINMSDLRAIPFVGAWSQLKQNVTGYYGVGTALQKIEQDGRLGEVINLYKRSLFFKTLIDNCEMAMKKCFFPLTNYLMKDETYKDLWLNIYDEYELTKKYVLMISGHHELMADYPVEQLSIQMRDRIVLPLLTIQQYAMTAIRELEKELAPQELKEIYEKLVMRCSFGIINAGRNSA
ncbi:phosphoenolpyruvate carboxylase [Gynurincola endophyticus]|uniref:phosphoenolpyruvate carboxylase n=1 Tax=Gynurincola endophyticus TaxID=2479004 RepID=UPI000F8D7DC7|nr:phosphoenolpyruvate carboxylase [Gynurincola endophyticus]